MPVPEKDQKKQGGKSLLQVDREISMGTTDSSTGMSDSEFSGLANRYGSDGYNLGQKRSILDVDRDLQAGKPKSPTSVVDTENYSVGEFVTDIPKSAGSGAGRLVSNLGQLQDMSGRAIKKHSDVAGHILSRSPARLMLKPFFGADENAISSLLENTGSIAAKSFGSAQERIGKSFKGVGKTTSDYWTGKMSTSGEQLLSTPFYKTGGLGNMALSAMLQASASAPETIAIGLAGGPVASSLKKAGFSKSMASALGRMGVTKKLAPKIAQWVESGISYGSVEGLSAGLSNADQVGSDIRKMSHKDLLRSESYQEYFKRTGSEKEAKQLLIDDAEAMALAATAVMSTSTGAVAGGGLFDKTLTSKRFLINRVLSGGKEGWQEFWQSGIGEALPANLSIKLANPDQESMGGVWSEGLAGSGPGFVMGLFGGSSHRGSEAQPTRTGSLEKNQKVLKIKQANIPTRDLIALKNNPEDLSAVGLTSEDIDVVLNDRYDDLERSKEVLAAKQEGGPLSSAANLGIQGEQAKIVQEMASERDQTQANIDSQVIESEIAGYDPNAPFTESSQRRLFPKPLYEQAPPDRTEAAGYISNEDARVFGNQVLEELQAKNKQQPEKTETINTDTGEITQTITPNENEVENSKEVDQVGKNISRSNASYETVAIVKASVSNIKKATPERLQEIEDSFDSIIESNPDIKPFSDVFKQAIAVRKQELVDKDIRVGSTGTAVAGNDASPNDVLARQLASGSETATLTPSEGAGDFIVRQGMPSDRTPVTRESGESAGDFIIRQRASGSVKTPITRKSEFTREVIDNVRIQPEGEGRKTKEAGQAAVGQGGVEQAAQDVRRDRPAEGGSGAITEAGARPTGQAVATTQEEKTAASTGDVGVRSSGSNQEPQQAAGRDQVGTVRRQPKVILQRKDGKPYKTEVVLRRQAKLKGIADFDVLVVDGGVVGVEKETNNTPDDTGKALNSQGEASAPSGVTKQDATPQEAASPVKQQTTDTKNDTASVSEAPKNIDEEISTITEAELDDLLGIQTEIKKDEKTAADLIKEASSMGVKGVDEALTGLVDLFGGSSLKSFPAGLSKEDYAKAKPHFEQSLSNFREAGKSLKDLIDFLLKNLGDSAKPYIKHWMLELQHKAQPAGQKVSKGDTVKVGGVNDGRVDKATDDAGGVLPGNVTTANEEAGNKALGGVASESFRRNEKNKRAGRDSAKGRATGPGKHGVNDRKGDPGARSGRNRPKKVYPSKAGAGSGRGDGEPGPVELKDISAAIPAADFTITEDVKLGQGGETVKFNDNISAIETLKQIETDSRRATPAEQKILSRYVGWGGLAGAFRNPINGDIKKGWEQRVKQLEAILTKDELDVARNSTKAAHYTSPEVVKGIWQAVEQLGFKGGSVLEPSMGTGNFLGLAPESIKGSTNILGVEYDSITARIAKKLYPHSSVIHSGFEKLPIPENTFGLVIGNPPFGKDKLNFPHSPDLNIFSIHNQFMLSGIQALKPGGIQAMVVSRYFLDAKDSKARSKIAEEAKLLGAIRLPDTAFKENARTDVVTDIVFFQKYTEEELRLFDDGTPKPEDGWTKTTDVADTEGGDPMHVSKYFADNPSHIIGLMDRTGSMRFGKDITVHLENPEDLGKLLRKRIKSVLPNNIIKRESTSERTTKHFKEMVDSLYISMNRLEDGSVSIGEDGKPVQIFEREAYGGDVILSKRTLKPGVAWSPNLKMDKDGRWFRDIAKLDENGNKVKEGKRIVRIREVFNYEADIPKSMLLSANNFSRLVDAVKMINSIKKQLDLEIKDSGKEIEQNRKELRSMYDAFRKKYGLIHDTATKKVITLLPDKALLMSLENNYKKQITRAMSKRTGLPQRKSSADPASILSERVTYPYLSPARVESPSDALAVTLSELGKVDLDRVGELLDMDDNAVVSELHDKQETPLIYYDPENALWVTADEYLGGNVARKLEAAKMDGSGIDMEKNVSALEKIQPEPWGADKITPVIGSTWIPVSVYGDFVSKLSGAKAVIRFSKLTNTYTVSNANTRSGDAAQWSTANRTVGEIVSSILNSKPIRITNKDSDGRVVVDQETTDLANDKAEEIKAEFDNWVFNESRRRNLLVDIFNKKYNVRVPKQRDGQHLKMPGKVPDEIIKLRRHQLNAIWRGIVDRFVLYDHAVGSGKTFTGISRAIERKRMGLSRKPMIVVPNHLVDQFAADVYKLYPGAKVLAASKTDTAKDKRRRLFANIATGDWDVVIMPHSSFGFIGISTETEKRYLEEELELAEDSLSVAEEEASENGWEGGSYRKPLTVKEAEALRNKIISRLEGLKNKARTKDKLLTFEQIGVDDLTIDESHEFKNLFYNSKLNVRGMNPKQGSAKAYDLWTKIRTLRESPTGSVAFMTGTPISNSAVEMYGVMRYLAADELENTGLSHFDSWRTQFTTVTTKFEPTESGRGLKEVSRIGRDWSNMRALMDMYYSFSDSVSNDDIKKWYSEDNGGKEFPIPKIKGGSRQLVNVDPTDAQESEIKDIVSGFETLDYISDVKERNAERLRLMDRARKVSLDIRATDPFNKSDEKGGKLEKVSDEVFRIYKKWGDDKGTQLIFLDRSIPKASAKDRGLLKKYDKLIATLNKAESEGNEPAYRRAVDSLEKYDTNEMEEIRTSLAGGWNAYQQIKDNLVERGIPEDEVRFIHEANTDEQKQEMFDMMNEGTIRVLIGSTPRMGAGTNVQNKLVALHHGDVTWKPSDIEQREGRIIRQGNSLYDKYGHDKFEVEIIAYTTDTTVDAKLWSLNATKLKMINGIRNYSGDFNMEFEDEDSIGMAEIAAIASGEPLQLERIQVSADIDRLQRQKRAFLRQGYGYKDSLSVAKRRIETLPGKIKGDKALLASLKSQEDKSRTDAQKRSVLLNSESYSWDRVSDALFELRNIQEELKKHKKKFKVNLNKKEFKSFAKAEEFIFDKLGDGILFDADINGNNFIRRASAARYLADQANKAVKDEAGEVDDQKIATVRIHGLDIDVSMDRMGKTVDLYAEAYLTTPGGERTPVVNEAMTIILGKEKSPVAMVNMKPFINRIDINQVDVEKIIAHNKKFMDLAEKDLPALEKLVDQPFKGEADLEEKQKRLKEIEEELSAGAEAISESQAAQADDGGEVQYSVSQATVPPSEQADIKAELESGLSKSGFRSLIRKGLLEIISPEQSVHILGMAASTGKGVKFSVSDRAVSPADYPDSLNNVHRHTSTRGITKHPDFNAAKEFGNTRAAGRIVSSIVKPEVFDRISRSIPNGKPVVVVPVLQREGESLNMLPLGYALRLKSELSSRGHDVKISTDIVKVSGDKNTNAKADDRAKNEHKFDGKAPSKDSHVIVVDDTFTSGSTITSLIDHLDANGVTVAQASTMSAGRYQNWLKIPDGKIGKFLDKVRLTEVEFTHETGYHPTGLTGSEIQGYLLNGAKGIEGFLRRFPTRRIEKSSARIRETQNSPEVKYSQSGKRIEGFTLNGKIYLVDGNISNGQAMPVLMHELSIHLRKLGFKDSGQFERVVKLMVHRSSVQNSKEGKIIREAQAMVPKNTGLMEGEKYEDLSTERKKEVDGIRNEEVLAYLVSNDRTDIGPVRKLFALLKKFLVERLGFTPRILNSIDMSALALSVLTREAEATSEYQSTDNDARYSVASGKTKRPVDDPFSLLDAALGKDVVAKTKKKKAAMAKKQADDKEKFTEEVISSASNVEQIAKGKPDMNIVEKLLSTAEYFFRKSGATRRMFEAQMNRRDHKFTLENFVFGKDKENTDSGFVNEMQELKKKFPKIYYLANKYLLKIDRTGNAFFLKRKTGYVVTDPYGQVSGLYQTKEEAFGAARKAAHATGKMINEYQVSDKKQNQWIVKSPDGKTVAEYENEKDATVGIMVSESALMKKNGQEQAVIDTVMKFRAMTNRAFDLMADDMRKIISEASEQGLDEPSIDIADESKRWGVFAPGAKMATTAYASRKMAEEHIIALSKVDKKFSRYKVKRQRDNQIQMSLSLSAAIGRMGDLRGSYFPRQRKPGSFIAIAENPKTGEKHLKKFDLFSYEREKIDQLTGEEITTSGIVQKARKAFNSGTFIGLGTPVARWGKKMQRDGFVVKVIQDESTPESVFDASRLMSSVDALLQSSLDASKKEDQGDNEIIASQVNKMLTLNIADIFKSRGFLSSRKKRTDEYWRGFEEDMLLAGTQYVKGVAGGISKRHAARQMTLAVTGRDISFNQWRAMDGNEAGTYEDYLEFVGNRRLDPGKQKRLHGEAMTWMQEILRNDETVDRVMGALKGAAVFKFLGFRVSSAVVNMTNMVQAVPATISSHSGGSLAKALRAIKQSATAYGKYRTGKGTLPEDDRALFLEISNRGWDEAQFNHDAAGVLQSQLGRGYDKVLQSAMYVFGAAEKANRAMTIHAAYKQHMAHGHYKVDPGTGISEAALQKAHMTSDRAHGVYGKETAPTWTQGRHNPLKLAYTFQKFSHNYLLNAFEMGYRGDLKQAMYMLFSPAILAGAGASLPLQVLAMVVSKLGGGDDPEEDYYAWLASFHPAMERFGRHGATGLAGINMKGSLQINNPMPTSLPDLGGAPLSVLTDIGDAAGHIRKGEFGKGFEKLLPTGIASPIKAIREYDEGITTGSYSPVYYGDQPLKGTAIDAALRFFSFNPSRLSGIREKQWHERKVFAKYLDRRSKINSKIKHALVKGNGKISAHDWAAIQKEILRYNELARGSGRRDIRPITGKSVRQVMRRSLRASKRERMRTKAA